MPRHRRGGSIIPAVIPRVYAPAAGQAGADVELDADEAAHLVRVLRLRAGAEVRVFDGAGREWVAAVRVAGKSHVTLALGAPAVPAPEPRVTYGLAVAVLKGDATDDVVRDAVMLGAAAVRPFVAARSETSLSALEKGRRVARWRRVAIASAKQCGRAVVPVIHDPILAERLWTDAPGPMRLLLLEPGADTAAVALADLPVPGGVTFAVGPEGGWSPAEVAAALGAGWRPARLGGRVLRAATAPLVALAAAQAVWRDA